MKKIITLLSAFLLLFVVAKAQVYFDDVESYEPFTINPTTGPWTFVDVDSCNTYRIGGYLWDNVLEPQAFIVFNPSFTGPEFTNSTGRPIQVHNILPLTEVLEDSWIIQSKNVPIIIN